MTGDGTQRRLDAGRAKRPPLQVAAGSSNPDPVTARSPVFAASNVGDLASTRCYFVLGAVNRVARLVLLVVDLGLLSASQFAAVSGPVRTDLLVDVLLAPLEVGGLAS